MLEDEERFTLKPLPSKAMTTLPPASKAVTIMLNDRPTVWVGIGPPVVEVTRKLATPPRLTTRLELAGPVIAPSLTVIAVVSAFVSVVASVVVDAPLVNDTPVVYDGKNPVFE